jgi:ribosomal protein S18 acetylase RimI-like enzyme
VDPDLEIRPARPDEYAQVGALVVAAYRAFYGGELGTYGRHLADVATRAREAIVLVATAGGTVVGSVTYVPDTASPYAEALRDGEAAIRMLATDPAWQRRGVGRALSVACIERARAAGRCALVLHADEVMVVARHLYEALGFRRDPSRDFWPDAHTQLRCYSLKLTESD